MHKDSAGRNQFRRPSPPPGMSKDKVRAELQLTCQRTAVDAAGGSEGFRGRAYVGCVVFGMIHSIEDVGTKLESRALVDLCIFLQVEVEIVQIILPKKVLWKSTVVV